MSSSRPDHQPRGNGDSLKLQIAEAAISTRWPITQQEAPQDLLGVYDLAENRGVREVRDGIQKRGLLLNTSSAAHWCKHLQCRLQETTTRES